MQEYKIILTWEAIYDVTDIADYIEEEFGQQRADRFQSDLKEQMQNLSQFSTAFPRTQILYRGYSIHKRSFPPSIIFYIIMEQTKEIHILRVLRHERDWKISCCKDPLIHIQNKYTGADQRFVLKGFLFNYLPPSIKS